MTWHKKIVVVSLFFWFLTVGGHSKASPAVINNLDSVLFDLSQAAYSSNTVEFPVYFNSDDTINAVDFALRFNQANLTLDTILNLSSGLQSTYFLNPGDSILRFSSYNLSVIPNLSNVALVRFFINTSVISISDLYDFDVFLNGFRCSWRVFDATNDIHENVRRELFSVFPIPADNMVFLRGQTDATYRITDCKGSVIKEGGIEKDMSLVLDVSDFPNGTYQVSFMSICGLQNKRIIILD
ncbi:MAG: hypothetical protein ACKOA1_06785 [Bacteroidota bacterium]